VRNLAGLALLLLASLTGCTARPASVADSSSTVVGYWVDRPAEVEVVAADYRALWDAANESLERFEFELAFVDYRGGELRSEPRLSGQWFEPWRTELRDLPSIAQSNLDTVRRSVHFEIERERDRYRLRPRVVVEQLARGERNLSAALVYEGVLGAGTQRRRSEDSPDTRFGWHAVGRDTALERSLANRIVGRVPGARLVENDTD
jgi:hypothetical protein